MEDHDKNTSDVLTKIKSLFQISPDVTELIFSDHEHVILKAGKRWIRQACHIFSEHFTLLAFVQNLADRNYSRFDQRHPYQGGSLEEGKFRWHAIMAPILGDNLTCCLHFRQTTWAFIENFNFSLTSSEKELLQKCMQCNIPLIIYGPTGSGKSSFLLQILAQTCQEERLIILESHPELPLLSPLWTSLIAKSAETDGSGAVSLITLFQESLRLCPDRIVVGELRDHEFEAFLQSILSGHKSSLTTIHAGSDEDVFQRLSKKLGPERCTRLTQQGLALIALSRERDFRIKSIRIYGQK